MRNPSLLPMALLALTAGACATKPAREPVTASSGSPVPLADHDWFLHTDENAARLAYGLAESDDLRLGLDCSRGSGRLSLSGMARRDDKREFLLESGGESERFAAEAEPSQLDDGVLLSAEAPADAPVFRRFRQLGWLAMWKDGVRQTYAPHPPTAPDIERFFAFCG